MEIYRHTSYGLVLTLLDVIVSQGAAILKLLSSKDQALLVGGDA